MIDIAPAGAMLATAFGATPAAAFGATPGAAFGATPGAMLGAAATPTLATMIVNAPAIPMVNLVNLLVRFTLAPLVDVVVGSLRVLDA